MERSFTPKRVRRSLKMRLPATLLLTLLLAPAFAQTWHTVGTGTSTNSASNYPSPFPDYYAGNRAQYIYLASDLTAAGLQANDPIVSLRWVVTALNECTVLDNYTMHVGHTSASSLSGLVAAPTGSSTVPVDYQPVTGNNDFQLKAPFIWDGSSNLLVEVIHYSTAFGAYSANASVAFTSTAPATRSYVLADDWLYKADQVAPVTSGSGAVLAATARPNIVLGVGEACATLPANGYELPVNTAVPAGEGLAAEACASSYGGHFTVAHAFPGGNYPFTFNNGNLNLRASITVPPLPAGAQMTAARLVLNNVTAGGQTPTANLYVGFDGAVGGVDGAIVQIAPNFTGINGNIPEVIFQLSGDAPVGELNLYTTKYPNASGTCTLGAARLEIDYMLPTPLWFSTASGGAPVAWGSAVFDPVEAGLVDPAVPGSTTFYVTCDQGPVLCAGLVRTPVDFVVSEPLDCTGVPGGSATVGSPCDDGDPATFGDAYDANCDCVGLPCSGDQLVVSVQTDEEPGQISWELLDAGQAVLASGGGYAEANAWISETVCLGEAPVSACYGFRLFDSFGDGIAGGGWELRTTDGGLLLRDDFSNGSQSPSASPANPNYTAHSFCLPAGPGNIAPTECGIFNNALGHKVYANKVAGASNYQFEFTDPDAGFIRRIARPYNYVHFWDMVSTPLVPGVKYFARVRTDRDGPMQQAHFGTGCEMGIGLPQVVTCSELIQAPAYGHSCNETRAFNTNNSFIWAKPVTGATEYQFRIFNTEEGYDQTFIRSTYILQLKWNSTVAPALINGYTYQVEVNVKVNGLYSGFCESSCTITIDNGGGAAMRVMETAATGHATLWPNPVRDGQVNLSLDGLAGVEQTILVDVQDIYGKQVFAKEYGNSGERFSTVLELGSEVASGVYMVGITVNGERTVQRLSVMR